MKTLVAVSSLLCLLACTPEPSAEPSVPPSSDSSKGDATPPQMEPVGHVDGAGAAKLLAEEPKVVILDIRTPAEYAEGHLKGANNFDYKAPDFAKRLEALDRSTKYLVHCRSGGRSTGALPTFEKLGFARIVHLDGGILSWQKAGNPVEK